MLYGATDTTLSLGTVLTTQITTPRMNLHTHLTNSVPKNQTPSFPIGCPNPIPVGESLLKFLLPLARRDEAEVKQLEQYAQNDFRG